MSQNCKSKLSNYSIVTQNDSESALLTLPDVPLLFVLQNVPLQSLIFNLPQVHSRFTPFCELVLKQSPPQRLLLYIGDLERIQKFKCSSRLGIPFSDYLVDGIPFVNYLGDPTTPTGKHRFPDPEFYRVHYVTLDDETVDKLITLMPVITHLEIVISQVNSCLISRLIRLLTHWAPTLKVLKFCGEFEPDDSQYLLALFHEMNLKLSVLEHLTLDLDGELSGKYEISARDLPIPCQLKELFIQSRDRVCVRSLLDSLLIHRAGDQLTAIGVAFPFAWDSLKHLVSHPLASRFTLLATQNEPRYELPPFPNRIGYSTNWHLNQPLKSLTSRLSTLGRLQYLELRRLSPYGSVSADPVPLSQLPSVEILRIHFNNSSFSANDHTVLQDPHWAYLFPSVQIVNLIHKGHFCAKCYPEDGNCSDKPPGFSQTSERTACLEQLLAPLTVLPSLRKIFYQRNEDLKNIAEFTGKGAFVKTHAYIY